MSSPSSRKSEKRKTSIEQNEEPSAKQRCVRRVFDDFPKEEPEPTEYDQEQFMAKYQLIAVGKEIRKEVLKVERKKRLAHSFTILSISSRRGQEVLMRNKHSLNLEASLERIERYCVSTNQEEAENNQVCTRAAAVFSAMYKKDEDKQKEDDTEDKGENKNENIQQEKWFHLYKWPHRTHNPQYPYMGPTIKPCIVLLPLLTEEEINYWTKRKRTVATMTPDGWWGSKIPICDCQKIPLIILDEEVTMRYKDKSSSTRCVCIRSKSQISPASSQDKKSHLEVKMETGSEEMRVSPTPESSVKARDRTSSESTFYRSGGFSVSGSSLTRSANHSVSFDKEGLGVVTYNLVVQGEASLNYKRALHRRPLAVVPPTPIAGVKSVSDVLCQPVGCFPQHTASSTSLKSNFNRSILDAIKWYTKEDLSFHALEGLNECLTKEELKMIDPSQENIKPLSELTLPNLIKPIDYFQQNLNAAEYDYCFKRSSDGTSKLVTRRGERHYANREPCPSCFQGRDNFCVYEFVRQTKLAGLTLQENQKQLQVMFFKFIQAVNRKF